MSESDQFQIKEDAAQFYDRLPARYILGPWSASLVAAVQITSDEHVLDLACGTGVVTREVERVLGPRGRVVGLDINEGMIDVAKKYERTGPGEISYVLASALETGLPGNTFDVVLCQQGFQFFPDQTKALFETLRVLKDRGRVCFSVWAESGAYNNAVAEAVRAFVDDATAERFLQSRDVPTASGLRQKFVTAGFRDVTVARSEMKNRLPNIADFVSEHLLGVPIADRVSLLSDAERRSLGEDAAKRLERYADGQDAVVPDCINLIIARK